jgi:hypothetical protein
MCVPAGPKEDIERVMSYVHHRFWRNTLEGMVLVIRQDWALRVNVAAVAGTIFFPRRTSEICHPHVKRRLPGDKSLY